MPKISYDIIIVYKGGNFIKYIEKNFEPVTTNAVPFALPNSMNLSNLEENIAMFLPIIRNSMGGSSKDITTRKIVLEDKKIKGYKNDEIEIRIYSPENKKDNCPCMLFIHGGGWIGGSIKTVDNYCKAVSDKADILVISVDYRLAPEFKYPYGLEDCYSALEWVWDNSSDLKIDKENIILSGDSAGGNFSSALSFMASDRKKIKISSQVLIYPAVDLSEDAIQSPSQNDETNIFGKLVKNLYLGDCKEYDNPYISPIKAKNFDSQPKTLIAVSEFDGLKSQGEEFAKILDEANIDTTLILFKNSHHAFIDNIGTSPQALELVNEVVSFINN